MKNSLPPEKFGEAALVKHSTHPLEKSTIKGLRDAIVLRSIVCGESPFCPLGFEVLGEFVTEKFPSAVASKPFDFCVMLGVHPRFEFLIRFERVILSV